MTQPLGLRALGRQGVVYGLGIVLNKAVSFVMLPIYTRFLTPADYGLLQLVTMTIEIISILAGSRLISGVFRFYHKAETEEQQRRVVATAVVLMGTLYLVAASAAAVLAPTIATLLLGGPHQADLVRLGALALALDGLVVVPLALLQIRGLSKQFVLTNTAKLLIGVACNIVFVVYYRMAARGVLTSTIVANAVLGVLLTIWVVRQVGLRPGRGDARDLLRFGMPFVVTQVATFLSTFGDRYFINAAAGASEVGLYALAYQFAFLYLTLAFVPLMTAWQPARFAIAKREDRDDVYAKMLVYASTILLIGGVGVAFFAGPTIRIMADASFHPAAAIVPVLVLAYAFQALTELVSTGLLISERTGAIAWANYIALGAALAGYVLLVPTWLGMGAAWATLISFALRFVLVYWSAQRAWPIAYRWGPIVRAGAMCTGLAAVPMVVPYPGLLMDLVMRVALFGLSLVAIWYLAIPDRADRRQIVAGVRNPAKLFGDLQQ